MSIKTILRTVIASGFVVGTVAALSPAAFAVDNVSGGGVSGGIAPIEKVTFTSGSAVTVDPVSGMTASVLGSVKVQSNDYDGWKLQVKSANGAKLIDAVSTAQIIYSLGVGSYTPNVSVAATDVDVMTEPTSTGGANPRCAIADTAECAYNVKGTITAGNAAGKPAGTYSDTLTFTLTNQ